MKNIKRIGCSFLMIVFMLSFMIANPIIAKADYTYKINIVLGGTGEENASFTTDWSSGLSVSSEGAVVKISSDKTVITISGLAYNDEIVINPKSIVKITASDDSYSKYYVKGIRRSGADAAPTKSAFAVTKDDSYVIAYGVGAVVPYTVSYKDTAGTKLLETETFYAAEGEEIYIPYRYVSGYTPNAYNLHCKSVKANQAFEFVYTKGTGGGGVINETRTETENISDGTTVTTVQGSPEYVYQTVSGPRQQGTINNRAAGGGQGGQGGQAEGGNAGGGNGNQNGESIEDANTPTGPQDVIDIEDEEVAKGITAEEEFMNNIMRYAIILTLIGILAIILVIVTSIKWKNNKDD